MLSTYFSGQLGRPLIASLLAGLSLLADLGLVWLLVPRLGTPGAALASTAAYLVTVVVMIAVFLRLSGARLREMLVPQAADLAAYRGLLRSILR